MPTPINSEWSDGSGSLESDERFTPAWVLDLVVEVMGGIDLDPCADPRKRVPATRHFTKEDDGLEQNWSGRVFLNPPFSRVSAWVQHLTLYLHTGSITEAMVLLPVATLTNKSSQVLLRSLASAFVMFERELKFLDVDHQELDNLPSLRSGPFAMLYVGPNTDNFLKAFSPHALPCLIQQPHAAEKRSFCVNCGKVYFSKRSTSKFCSSTCRVEAHRRTKKSNPK